MTALWISFLVFALAEMGEDREPGRADAEREPRSLGEDERAQREAALLAQEADGLVATSHGQERRLACDGREPDQRRVGELLDREA